MIKGQVLEDFVLEFPPHQEVDSLDLVTMTGEEVTNHHQQNSAPWWSLYVDGAANGEGAGAGMELITPEGLKLRGSTHLAFHATNNDAEYEALISGI